jgi:hypothetical protein
MMLLAFLLFILDMLLLAVLLLLAFLLLRVFLLLLVSLLICCDPGVPILAGGFTYWMVGNERYYNIRLSDYVNQTVFFFAIKLLEYRISYWRIQKTIFLAQTRTGIGLLGISPAVKQFPSVESHLGVRATYANRRKRRYEANKCG